MTIPTYLLGLDLGQAHDYSAWITAERSKDADEESCYDVRHIDRVRGARYPAIVAHTADLITALRSSDPKPAVHLVVDYTGVGRPVADMLVDAKLDCTLRLVTITGADTVTRGETGELRVPKRDLASGVQVLLQSERLRIGKDLPHATTLTDELVNFKVKISLAGHDSYGAGADWREGNHDDLVLALALACWFGEHRMPPPSVAAWGAPRRSGSHGERRALPDNGFSTSIGRGWR